MSNKKLHLILGLVLAMFVGVIGAFTSAVSFTIEFGDYAKLESWGAIRQNMVPIHFKDNGNDFHGFIYFSDGIVDLTGGVSQKYYVQLGSSKPFDCQKKVKGFYYNAERGERLWPLDGEYGGIIAEGGLYTRCRESGFFEELERRCKDKGETEREECEREIETKYVDSNGYYGIVKHTYNGQTVALVAGTDYEVKPGEKRITVGNKLAPTFVRIGNQYPVGFIYDGNGGAGFVGCEIEGDANNAQTVLGTFKEWVNANGKMTKEDWHNLFTKRGNTIGTDYVGGLNCSNEGSAMNSLIKVVVDGLVGINKGPENKGIQGNQSNAKMQYFSSVSVNNMQLINYARQRAEILCRGKWNSNYVPSPADGIVCVSSSTGDPIVAKTNETLIVKGGRDVKITDMEDFNADKHYDIFVDGGNLLIDINPSVTDLTVFKRNGFKSESSLTDFKAVVNTVREAGLDYSGDDVAAGRFIKGNFIVNGGIRPASPMTGLQNVYFIYGKMTSKDTVDKLEEVFAWRCNVGVGSDTQKTPCPGGWKDEDGNIWTNPYQNASLVIIDQNYPSPLYE